MGIIFLINKRHCYPRNPHHQGEETVEPYGTSLSSQLLPASENYGYGGDDQEEEERVGEADEVHYGGGEDRADILGVLLVEDDGLEGETDLD